MRASLELLRRLQAKWPTTDGKRHSLTLVDDELEIGLWTPRGCVPVRILTEELNQPLKTLMAAIEEIVKPYVA